MIYYDILHADISLLDPVLLLGAVGHSNQHHLWSKLVPDKVAIA